MNSLPVIIPMVYQEDGSEPPNVKRITEYVYDNTVWIVKSIEKLLGVFATENLADEYIRLYRTSVRLSKTEWRIIRSAKELFNYCGPVG